MNKWSLIHTSPKDGRSFLVYIPTAKKHSIKVAYWLEEKYLVDQQGVTLSKHAVYWTQLPTPPKHICAKCIL